MPSCWQALTNGCNGPEIGILGMRIASPIVAKNPGKAGIFSLPYAGNVFRWAASAAQPTPRAAVL